MRRGDLVRIHHSFRALYGHGQVVEFVAGALALVVSQFVVTGRTHYNVLYDGQVLAVDGFVIEPLDPCNPQPTVV